MVRASSLMSPLPDGSGIEAWRQALGDDSDFHVRALADEAGDGAATPQHFIVGVRRDDQNTP